MRPKILRQWENIPGAMTTIDGLQEYAKRLAAGEQDKRGHCRTQWIIVRERDAMIISTPWTDDTQKEQMLEWLRTTFAVDQSIARFAYMTEAWIRSVEGGDITKLGSRVDSLVINTQQRDGQFRFTLYEVTSGSGRRKNRKDVGSDVDVLKGEFADLFGAGDTGLFSFNSGG